jgi:hypothetical protein
MRLVLARGVGRAVGEPLETGPQPGTVAPSETVPGHEKS